MSRISSFGWLLRLHGRGWNVRHRGVRPRPEALEPLESRQLLAVQVYVPSGGDIQAAVMQAWNARADLNDRDLVVHLSGGGSYDVDLGYGANDHLTLGSSALGVSSFTIAADQGNTGAFANVRLIDAGEKGDPDLTFSSFYNAFKDSSPSTASAAYFSLPFGTTSWMEVAYSGSATGQRNIDVRIEGVDVEFAYRRSDGAIVDGREVNLELRPNIPRPSKPDASVPSTDVQWTRYNIWNFFYQRVQLDGTLIFHRGIGSLDVVNSRITGGGKNIIAEGFSSGSTSAKIPLVRLDRVISRDAHRWNADKLDFGGFHPAGIYVAQTDRIELLGSVFAHNGWKRNADGTIPGEYAPNIWSHGAYIQSDNTFGNALIRDTTFVDNASEGLQLRSGGDVEDSLFVGNATGGFFTRGTLTRSAFFEQTDLARTGSLSAPDKGGGWALNANDPPRSGPMVVSSNVFGWKAGGAGFQGPINNNVNSSSVSYTDNRAWSYGSKESYLQHSAYVYTGPGLAWLSTEPASRSAYPGGGMRAAVQRSEDRTRSGFSAADSASQISAFYREPGQPDASFPESNGRVEFEAEAYHDSAAGTGLAAGNTWNTFADGAASGGSALRADPNLGINTLDTTAGARRDYRINFANTGTYYVWVKMNGATGSDDSVHIGLDNAPVSFGGGVSLTASQRGIGWVWTNAGAGSARLAISVTTPGVHSLNLWMREDGTRLDRFILTRDASFNPGGSGGFNETGGRVEFQAEAFTGSAAGTGSAWGHNWTQVSDGAAGGGAALVANPNVNLNVGDAVNGPRRDYLINFTTTGTYYVWVRMNAANGNDDSLHVGLNSSAVSVGGGVSLAGSQRGAGWVWTNAGPGGTRLTINVNTPGAHRLNLWMREDGAKVDQFILTTDATFNPIA